MDDRKRYLFLVITDCFAGAEHFLVDYFGFIDFKKYRVMLGVRDDVFSHYLQQDNLPVEVFDLPKFNETESFFSRLRNFRTYLATMQPECIVFNQYFLRSFALPEIVAAFLFTRGNSYSIVHDCPPAYPEHPGRRRFGFLREWKYRRLQLTLLGYFSKKTIAVSRAARDALVHTHRFPMRKVETVYHGVNIQKYRPDSENRQQLRQHFDLSGSDIVIISTAMLLQVKRVDRAVRAFGDLAGNRSDIHLFIVGTGSEYNALVSMAGSFDASVKKRIRFLGFRNDISHLLQMSDVYVLPSDTEGLPLACLEAMASGLICVVTDCGGTTEIIQNEQNGFLVERTDSGVHEGIRKVLELSNGQRREISLRARTFIEKNFNLQKNIRSGLGVLRMLNTE